ncbi:MAG: hypothetical protein II868_06470, partial [Butyrivibrio sp.]|nr:hypothetical protein [Butyrivibrio sp.]
MGLLDYGYDDGLEMLADYADYIRDDAEDMAASLVDNGFIWTVALDKKNQIALIMIQDDYNEIVYERAVDGKAGTEAFYAVFDGVEELMVYNDYTISGSKRTGEVSFDVQGSVFALEYDIDLSKKSVFGIPYGTYFTDLGDIAPGLEAELSVTGGKSGSADHVFTVSGLEDLTDDMISSADITVNATSKSSAKEPSGTKEDISDYDEEELMELLDTLGYDIIDALSESPELADLADLLLGY